LSIENQDKEVALLSIIAEMGGTTDSSESKWSWLNWFTSDEVHGKHSDTFNRCHEKGWLETGHNTDNDTSTTSITAKGRVMVGSHDRKE
jgi:hypothetical protein